MPAEQSARALHQFRAAMEARDVAAVVDSFAPDAVFRSPLTERLAFTGSEQIGTVTEVVLGVFDDLRCTDAFFRPLPAAAAALRLTGVGLARKKSPARAAAVSVMAAPLAFLTRTGDPVGVRLVS